MPKNTVLLAFPCVEFSRHIGDDKACPFSLTVKKEHFLLIESSCKGQDFARTRRMLPKQRPELGTGNGYSTLFLHGFIISF